MGTKSTGFLISLLIILYSTGTFAQGLLTAKHETDDQRSVDVTLSTIPSTAPATSSFRVLVDGVPMSIAAITGIPAPAYRITFTQPLPVGPESVKVIYIPDGSEVISENNRLITCSDFEWTTNTRPTPPCAPVDPINRMVFRIKPGARNSSFFDFSKVAVNISWNDASKTISTITSYESDEAGMAKSGTNFLAFDADTDDFTYPADDKASSYTSEWRLTLDGSENCVINNPNQIITYTSHNVDDMGDGRLSIGQTVANSDEVCLFDEVNVQFKDESILNSVNAPTQPNNEDRWVRIIYGHPGRADEDRIPNIHINGIPVTDDHGVFIDPKGAGNLYLTSVGIIYTGNGADAFGVKYHPAPVYDAVGKILPITSVSTPEGLSNRKPGDKFLVRMEYWNICNSYDNIGNASGNERSVSNDIEIIDIPKPPLAVDTESCFKDEPVNFSIIRTETDATIRWYNADPKKGGRLMENPLGKKSLDFPSEGLVDSSKPGTYSVWVTQVSDALNSCESEAVEVVMLVKDPLTKPGEISGPVEICNGSSGISFKMAEAEGSNEHGGEWEYVWKHTGGGGVSFEKNTGQEIKVNFNIETFKEPFITRKIQVARRYKNSEISCSGESTSFTVKIYNSSVGGEITGASDICEGEDTGELILTGQRGEVLTWQRQFNDGSFTDIAGTRGLTSYKENIEEAGKYSYRAVVVNGTCGPAFSKPSVVNVNKIPTKPLIESSAFKACAEGGEVKLKVVNISEDGNIFTWFKSSDLSTPVQSGPNPELVLNKVAQSGNYVVKVAGALAAQCESVYSDPVEVTIFPLASATATGGGSVCAGNPAPDITWHFTGVAPYSFTISVTGQPDIVVEGYQADSYSIKAPSPDITTVYQLTSLSDASGCSTGSLGDAIEVNIGGIPPVLENISLAGGEVCDDGEDTILPSIHIDLDNPGIYAMSYSIDELELHINFETDIKGHYALTPDYKSAPINRIPGSYRVKIHSIYNTATGCQTPVNESFIIQINERPQVPSNPLDVFTCSDESEGRPLTVREPAEGFVIRWFKDPAASIPVTDADGMVSGSGNNAFKPVSSATTTYYAATENMLTGCLSAETVAVNQVQQEAPVAIADLNNTSAINITCSDEFILNAGKPSGDDTGTWSGPEGIIFSDRNDPAAVVTNLPVGETTLTWTVSSASGICKESFDEIKIIRDTVPAAKDPKPVVCADDINKLQASGINLVLTYTDQVTGTEGSPNLRVSWFSDPARKKEIKDPYNFTAVNVAKVYTRVTNLMSNCFSEGIITFTVTALPEALDVSDELCENGLNSNEALVDLNYYNQQVIGSASASERKIEWYSNPARTVAVPNPSAVKARNGEIFYARITDITNSAGCSNEAEVEFTVNSLPENNTITGPTVQCEGSSLQLYQVDPLVNPGSTYRWEIPADFKVYGGGGKNDFFVLLNFPVSTTAELKVTEISPEGCRGNEQSLQVSVVDSPEPLHIFPSDLIICENESGVVFNVAGLPGTTYAWSVPAGSTIIKGQGTNEIMVNFGTSGGTVSVIPTGTSGSCAGSAATTRVTVNERAQLAVLPNHEVCSNEPSGIRLSYDSNGTPATGYNITNIVADGGLVPSSGNAKPGNNYSEDVLINDSFSNSSGISLTVRYFVQAVSENGCAGATEVVTLIVNPEPVVRAIPENIFSVSCPGAEDAVIKVTATGGIAPYRYILKELPENTTGAETGVFTGLPIGTYSVTVTDSKGCSSEISTPVVVKDPVPLNAGLVFGEPVVCEGELPSTFRQISAAFGGNGNYQYQWQVSSDGINYVSASGSTSGDAEYSAVAEDFAGENDTFYFRRMVSSGNSYCSSVASNIIEVKVNPLPKGDFTFKDTNGNIINEICAGEPFLIEFTFNSKGSGFAFEYQDDKGNKYFNSRGSSTTPVLINFEEVESTTTFTLSRITDMYGCQSSDLNVSRTIHVNDTDAKFSVIGSQEGCSPATIDFEYNQVKGITYTWRWFDGSADSTYTATSTVSNKRVQHTFRNGSPTNTINYEVFLFASGMSETGAVCEDYSFEKVTIYPQVRADIMAQRVVGCSDDEFQLINLSQGAQQHRWFYREIGNTEMEEQVQTTKDATFRIVNSGPNNPQVYEIVYTGYAGGKGQYTCSDTEILTVEVYKKAVPDFEYKPDPVVFENGSASVVFRNLSSPNNDNSSFSYNWSFGDGMIQNNIPNPAAVIYYKPGQKNAKLTIVNKAAPGLCDVSVEKSIIMKNLPISPKFTVANTRFCRGGEVFITNESEGSANEFVWEIFDEHNNLVHRQIDEASSGTAKITKTLSFTPTKAGHYNVYLIARNTWSNDEKQVVKEDAFEVYELPVANFDTRPDVIFIPDQPLITFNLSNNADTYTWNFGDGTAESFEIQPEHRYKEEGKYLVTLTASATYPGGMVCSSTVSREIVAESGSEYQLPNAFTPSPYGPSGDGRIQREEDNDIFLPITKGVEEFQMIIYNRWGEVLFHSNDSTVGWDGYNKNGKLYPAGVYVYHLTLRFSNGQSKKITGDVTLIR